MSKRAFISRYMLIIKKLRIKPYASFEEIEEYLQHQFEYLQMNDENISLAFSKRTLQRDIKEISNLFGINIIFSSKEKGYFLDDGNSDNMNFQRMMESFDLFNSLNVADDLSAYVYLEKRKPLGTQHLYGLMHSIKNRIYIEFEYEKFYDESISHKQVKPFALKEFKNRWYLLAEDVKTNECRTYGLDRISNLIITNRKFAKTKDANVHEMFKHCFGITSANDDKPVEVVLSFDKEQGKYIKSLPLHETQEIIVDNNNELQIRLNIFITYEFVMELLSYGSRMKVIKPAKLINEMKKYYQKALKQYEK